MELVAMDIFHWNNQNWLIIVDAFSRWAKLYHMNNIASKDILNVLATFFKSYKYPETIMVDAGSNMNSAEMKGYCLRKNIKLYSVSPNNHKGNGICERAIQTIKNKMNKINEQHGWNFKKVASKAVKAYNFAHHKAIGSSPNLRWYGREIWDKKEHQIIIKNRTEEIPTGTAVKVYKVGDPVAHRNLNRNKFSDPRWLGPARIVELGQFDSYWIQDGIKTFKRNFQDIRSWTAKISSKTITKPPRSNDEPTPPIPTRSHDEPTPPIPNEMILPRDMTSNQYEVPIPEARSPVPSPVKAIPKASQKEKPASKEAVPDKSSMSETFRSIGLPDPVYERKLKLLADKRNKKK
eukprot:TRINITY_DN1425_c0_g1_i1.p1 TRINITY_DN1425_c0_g1~~TRINITY_DN1425_c0_g1_i1.p1  ORF type:complete len:349 (-),score=57.63 TRINITY_DN1425_c0_g1_i1:168-1214(-)